eukprot:COSAG05_NODE_2361_length_3178_cov_23.311465_2_plen_95_part_00
MDPSEMMKIGVPADRRKDVWLRFSGAKKRMAEADWQTRKPLALPHYRQALDPPAAAAAAATSTATLTQPVQLMPSTAADGCALLCFAVRYVFVT